MNDDKFTNTENIGTLKSGVVPMVSYCNLGTYPNGKPVHPYSVGNDKGKPATELSHIPFSQAIEETQKIKEKHDKGTDGMIFPYIDPRRLMHKKDDMIENNVTTGGVLFLDIDHFDYLKEVLDHFKDYIPYMPDIMCGVYSWSGKGIHLYFVTDNLTPTEYAKSVAEHFAMFYLVTKKLLGDEAAAQMPINSNDDSVCDKSCLEFTQREYLAYTPVICWNEWATKTVYTGAVLDEINKVLEQDEWFEIRNKLIPVDYSKIEYTPDDCEYEIRGISDNITAPYIIHSKRWVLFRSLVHLFGNSDELWKHWERCARLIPERNGHNAKYYIEVPRKENWLRGDGPLSIKMLRNFGYDVVRVNKYVAAGGYENATTLTGDLTGYKIIDVALGDGENIKRV